MNFNFIIIKFLKKLKKELVVIIYNIKYFLANSKFKKKYLDDFYILHDKLTKKENFAFVRFSDGELFIIRNLHLTIEENVSTLDGKVIAKANYTIEEKKNFDPKLHQFYRNQLIQSLKFDKNNYFKGIPCSCCSGKKEVDYIKNQINLNINTTFSNLLINANYTNFINLFIKEFQNKNIILIANQNANISKLPFKCQKFFPIGENCFVNDNDLYDVLLKYIKDNDIKNYVFLFSASSLSNVLIHKLYDKYDNNTYIDIGSSLNPYLDLKGWKSSRGYLMEYWYDTKPKLHIKRKCFW